MPRNVVTVRALPFRLPTRGNRDTRRRVTKGLVERFRARAVDTPVLQLAIDFPKQESHMAAKQKVEAALDEIDSRWRRVFVVYPTQTALYDRDD